MFKISYTVDDKRLPEMIRATFDHVTDLKVTPMDTAPSAVSLDKPRSHKALPDSAPSSKVEINHTMKGRNFIQELGWKKGFQFGTKDVAKRCTSLGLNVSARWYVIAHEYKYGRTKKIGLGRYEVL
jgi:hypothetical protein